MDYPGGGIYRQQFEKFFTTGNSGVMADLVFNTLDSDNNGYLDFKEFMLAVDLVAARTPDEKLLWAFKLYDVDNSGQIDQAEMKNVMRAVYDMLGALDRRPKDDPDERAMRIFKDIDVNNDGQLTQSEFLKGCQRDDKLMKDLEGLFLALASGLQEE